MYVVSKEMKVEFALKCQARKKISMCVLVNRGNIKKFILKHIYIYITKCHISFI